MSEEKKRGVVWLLLFWIFCLLMPKWPSSKKEGPPTLQTPSLILMEPLTPQEKILWGHRLSINELSEKDWEILPRIGPLLAQKIVAYRRQKGRFENLEILLDVRGMGQKTLESLRPFLKP